MAAGGSSAWLLRLFQSQQFFNCWIAVNYLFKYGNSIGIQHYLCRRLGEFPLSEIEFLLPQLLHYYLFARQKSMAALESFLLASCRRSSHITLLLLWYLEAYLNELVDDAAFIACQMLHEKCLLVLSDSSTANQPSLQLPFTASAEQTEPRSQQSIALQLAQERQRAERLQLDEKGRTVLTARAFATPALIGIGSMLAGLASPFIMQATQVEGERVDTGEELQRLAMQSPSPSRSLSLSLPASQAELATMVFQQHHNQQHSKQTMRFSNSIISGKNADESFTVGQSLLSLHGTRYRQPSIPGNSQRVSIAASSASSGSKRSLVNYLFTTRNKIKPSTKQASVTSLSQAAPSLEELHTGEAFSLHRFMIKTNSYHNLRKLYGSPDSSPSASSSRPATSASIHLHQTFGESLQIVHQIESSKQPQHQPKAQHPLVMDDLSSLILLQPAAKTEQPPAPSATEDSSNICQRTTSIRDDISATGTGTHSSVIDPDRRASLADKHYFHSELQFVSALMEISGRLVSVPREARLSSLRAELALLNHNFPARVCIPLWCEATAERPFHHQLVRICPEEAVILNSADRVPYLILVEVLETDADHPDGFMDELQKLVERAQLAEPAAPIAQIDSVPIRLNYDDHHHDSDDDVAGLPVQSESTAPLLFKNYRAADSAFSPLDPPAIKSNTQTVGLESQPPSPASPQSAVRDKQQRISAGFLPRMRTAAIMLAQLADPINSIRPVQQKEIRSKILKEMVSLEELRLKEVTESMSSASASLTVKPNSAVSRDSPFMEEQSISDGLEDGMIASEESAILNGSADSASQMQLTMLKEDPSASVLNEDWEEKCKRIRQNSPYGSYPTWRLLSVIVKSGADLRQEQLACQLIQEMHNIWQQERLDLWVYNFRILVTSNQGGLIETIPNTISVHSLKKQAYAKGEVPPSRPYTLYDFFRKRFGQPSTERYQKAQQCFMRSLAGYSLATYILAIKDRHNGNILIDSEGHIIHIDFGFMLYNSPGAVGFESAPFKLCSEYVDILGGLKSPEFEQFKHLLFVGLQALRKHADKIILLIEMLQTDSRFPCFSGNPAATIQALRDRFLLSMTERQVQEALNRMIWSSYDNIFSRLYDSFQYYSNGIL